MSQNQHRSISYRLKRAKTPEKRQEVAHDWAANWQSEQKDVIALLDTAIEREDYDQILIYLDQIKGITDKRFPALFKVLTELSGAN